MKIKVTDLLIGKSCIQDTTKLKIMTELQFIEYLDRKQKENILDYKIL